MFVPSIYLIISVFLSFGFAISLVEKGQDYPIRKFNLIIRKILHDIFGYKFSQVLDCTVCSSFWLSLVSDIILCIISGGTYFFWPISGFITLGFTWFIIEFLNGIDKGE